MGSLSEAAFHRGNGLGAMDKLVQGEDGEMTVEDDYRIEYLRDHIRQMEEAVMDGVDLMGIYHMGMYRSCQCIDSRASQALRIHLCRP